MARLKRILIGLTAFTLVALGGISCKTCNCPAYSEGPARPAMNMGKTEVQKSGKERFNGSSVFTGPEILSTTDYIIH